MSEANQVWGLLRVGTAIAWLWATAVAQANLPRPAAPPGNLHTVDKVMLGKALFWDEQLSTANAVACGTCHILGHDGTDPRTPHSLHPGADGRFGTGDDSRGSPGVALHDRASLMLGNAAFGLQKQVTRRRAPSVINAAYNRRLFVDGRAGDAFVDPLTNAVVLPSGAALETQVLQPLLDTTEMAHVGRNWNDVVTHVTNLVPLAIATQVPANLRRFVAGHTYASLFQQVFGSPGVTPTRIAFAIAAYERTLVSDQSPFDEFLAGRGTLGTREQEGLRVFQRLCATCHTDLDHSVRTTGPVLDQFANIGVRPPHEDLGREAVTGSRRDRGKFRVPALRNVALRSSYFHNGSQTTLAGVLDFYDRGGDFDENQDERARTLAGRLSATDKINLINLLHSLTDARVANELPPFDRPRLWLEGPLVPTAFGVGAGGTDPRPARINALGTAYLGSDVFGVGIDHVAPHVFTALMVDLAGSTTPTSLYGLPFYLGRTPALLTLPLGFSTRAPDGTGYKSHVFHVPPALAASGTYWLQFVTLDPGAPLGFACSNAMTMVVP